MSEIHFKALNVTSPSSERQIRRFSPWPTRASLILRRSVPIPSSISRWPDCMRTRKPKPWIVRTPFLLMGDLREVGDCCGGCDAAAKGPRFLRLAARIVLPLTRGGAIRCKYLYILLLTSIYAKHKNAPKCSKMFLQSVIGRCYLVLAPKFVSMVLYLVQEAGRRATTRKGCTRKTNTKISRLRYSEPHKPGAVVTRTQTDWWRSEYA